VDAADPTPAQGQTSPDNLLVETLVANLDTPWDLVWGPDGMIWFTERAGRVSRADPATGEVTAVGEIPGVWERGEGGLMGMAFHPDFGSEPWVYLAHSYQDENGGVRNRLVRALYQAGGGGGAGNFGTPQTLIDGIPGRGNHNGSRLAFGPDGFLYMTMGDAGSAASAQDLTSLSGKILRLRPDGQAAPGNPFGTRLWSYGHRNTQGLVFHPESGRLYISEHGPSDNDEVHRVVEGGNHGWPAVHGRCDGDASGEETYCRQNQVVESLAEWTPTVGIAGADIYLSDAISGWRGSLLVVALAGRRLFRLELSADGGSVVAQEALFQGQYGRLRDVLVGPDGAVYLATSNRDGRGSPASDDDRILRVTAR
jgi:glucose/arabinose dehydrogenase